MANRSSVTVFDGIGPVLGYMVASTVENVAEAMMSGAEEVKNYAQSNAPWSDITGAARAGLDTSLEIENGVVILELFHTVEYGVWLETIMNGTYAVILPTLEALGPGIVKDAGGRVITVGSTY